MAKGLHLFAGIIGWCGVLCNDIFESGRSDFCFHLMLSYLTKGENVNICFLSDVYFNVRDKWLDDRGVKFILIILYVWGFVFFKVKII